MRRKRQGWMMDWMKVEERAVSPSSDRVIELSPGDLVPVRTEPDCPGVRQHFLRGKLVTATQQVQTFRKHTDIQIYLEAV